MPNPLARNKPYVREENSQYVQEPLATLDCVVERITYHNAENGYSVLKVMQADVKDKVKADLIPVIGSFQSPKEGECLRIYGVWSKHPKHGSQLKAERYETLRPATAAAMEKYLGSGMVKGIGPKMAERIIKKFGDQAFDIIENHPDKLATVQGIGEKRVELIQRTWHEQKEIRNVMTFLQSHGISPTYALKIYRKYKDRSIEIVEQNPYQLAQDIWGIGFKSADKIAQNLGIALDAPARLEAGLVFVLNDQMDSGGHCFLPREELIKKACEILLPQTAPEGDTVPDQDLVLRAHAIENALDSLIERELLVAETINLLGAEETAIYTPAIITTEKAVAERIHTLLNSPWRSRLKPAEIDAIVSGLPGSDTLSDEQMQAVRRAISEPVMVLTGGPGTGKTTTTRVIIEAFVKLEKRLEIASPTGRAAKRASEVTGREAKTIHRLLAFDPEKNDFKHGPGEPLELDVLVIDESSMLDLVLTHKTLRAVPDGAQVIFVGDVDQLPSVGPGNVLSDLINSGRVPVARLTQVFRQAAASKIITNAHAINKGKIPELLPPSEAKNGADCVFIEISEPEEAIEKIKGVVAKSLPRMGFAADAITVLTPMQRGSLGGKNLNEILQTVLNPKSEMKLEHMRGPITFRVGDRVMQRRNNYDKNVFNGDVGNIIEIDPENQTLAVQYPEQVVEYDFPDTDEIYHSFANTIHKCIAEYERVWTKDRGMVPIRDIQVGDYVATGRDGGTYNQVTAKWETGAKPVWRVTTGAGFQMDVSAEHPLLIQSADSLQPAWRTASEVTKGDVLCVYRKPLQSSDAVKLPAFTPLATRPSSISLSLPTELDENISYLLGAIIGDGSYRDQKDGTVDFTNTDPEILERVEALLSGYGLRVRHYQGNRNAKRLYVVSRAFRRWLLELGLSYVCAGEKSVPSILFAASQSCRAAFLRGLFDTDGSAGTGTCRQVRLVTASKQLGLDVQRLLLSLGIVSRRSRVTENAWCLGIGGTSLARFAAQVGFGVIYKTERMNAILAKQRSGKSNDDHIPHGKLIAKIITERLRRSPIILSRTSLGKQVGIALSGVRCDGFRLSYRHLRDCAELFASMGIEPPCELRCTLENHYFFDSVVSVEALPETATMYDITVEGEHSFVAGGGFVCHNSQGSEYPACIIVMANQHYTMLQRNLLYTGLTRAKKMAVIIGSKWALKTAINNRLVTPRFTRLAERLQNLVESLRRQGALPEGSGNGLLNRDLSHPPLPGRLL